MQRIVKDLINAVGLADSIEIIRRWGGKEVYIPVKVEPNDPMALALGLESARKLVAAYSGQRLQLPAERKVLVDMRNAAIMRDVKDGMSHEKAGLLYGLTRQQIGHIIKQHRERNEFAGTGCAVAA